MFSWIKQELPMYCNTVLLFIFLRRIFIALIFCVLRPVKFRTAA